MKRDWLVLAFYVLAAINSIMILVSIVADQWTMVPGYVGVVFGAMALGEIAESKGRKDSQ